MKPVHPWRALLLSMLFVSCVYSAHAVTSADDLPGAVKEIAASQAATLHELATTPGGRPVQLLEIGRSGEDTPGVLVVANMTGDSPLATEAALILARQLSGDQSSWTDRLTWYIQPCGNPDGYAHLFANPVMADGRNDRPFDDDMDRRTDEDGPDDLNGDGLISIMRQIHPEGRWVQAPDRPYLVEIEPGQPVDGDRYRVFSEGIDNDGDGAINEDGPGGVNPGLNFPHRWELHTHNAGRWPASEPEARELMAFAFDRPNIALVIVLGRANTLRHLPDTDREGDLSKLSYEVPGWLTRRANLKRGTRMTIGELLPIVKDALDRPGLTAESLVGWLSNDAETDPHPGDLVALSELSERYTAHLDRVGASDDRLPSPESPPGSVEEWAYYQYGVPVFALDFWTPPDPTDAEEDSSAAEDEVDANGEVDEANDLHDSELDVLHAYDPDAWLPWTAVDHPTLGRVEIGGLRPTAKLLPRDEDGAEAIEQRLPFVFKLAAALPRLEVSRVEIEERAGGVYQLDVWISNDGLLPLPTHHGQRTRRPVPVVAELSGVKDDAVLEGRQRQPLGVLDGHGGSERVRWVLAAKPGATVTITVGSPAIATVSRSIRLEGGAR